MTTRAAKIDDPTITIECNLGHDHTLPMPPDLITISQAAEQAHRAISTIMTHIRACRLIGYPIIDQWGKTRTYISQHELEQKYPQASP